MPNVYEQRLHQIELLLRAYITENDGEGFEDEINKLKEERNLILDELINERLLKDE